MPELYYKDALKQGQKEFKSCVAGGVDPYLPVLDARLPAGKAMRSADLGLVQLPLELVVGTRHAGRTHSFARNFMPLMDELSEFAYKWQSLCCSHLEEGIRDPIRVCEYMNRYYVEEGNKRVSVLKFFSAVSVAAQVTRILPERDGSKEVELYYEYVDFYRHSKVNYLEFSKQGSCAALQELLGKAPDEDWTEEDRTSFATACYYFRRAYEMNGGAKLHTTLGDALLTFLRVYGYDALKVRDVAAIRELVGDMWEEIALQQEEAPIDVRLRPEAKKESLLRKVLSVTEPKVMKVAFIHDKNPEISGWTRAHEGGRRHVQQAFAGQLETRSWFDAMDSDPHAVIEEAIDWGAGALFTTSPRLLPASLRAAVEHPEVTLLNCSLNKPHRYIRSYYARMYEAKFVIGAVAGAMSMDDCVGYLCDYPIFGQIAGINAFALGAQLVNPRIRVCLEWSSVGGPGAALQRLTERGVRIISCRDIGSRGEGDRGSFGLSLFTGEGQVRLVRPIWQWGAYYEELIRRIRDKTLQVQYEQSSKALNYYWGMASGVVSVECTDRIPAGTRRLAELLSDAIRAGACDPFRGPIHTLDGRVIGEGDRPLPPEQLIGMDWLADCIDGELPRYGELNETAQATVDQVGVQPSKRPEP